jgi:hypothetical protein
MAEVQHPGKTRYSTRSYSQWNWCDLSSLQNRPRDLTVLAPEIGTISFIFGKPIPLFTGQNIAKRSPRIFSSTSISTPVNKPKLAERISVTLIPEQAKIIEP